MRLRLPRRIRFTRGGAFFSLGALAIGTAAVYSGNNLLYLLLGSMLGLIAVSGWLSERTLRGLEVHRHAGSPAPVGEPLSVTYTLRNRKKRLSSFAIRLREDGLPNVAFIGRIGPGQVATTRATHVFIRRGVYPLERLTLETEYPFGLFRKSRDLTLPGELLAWPRLDRRTDWLPAPGRGRRHAGTTAVPSPGARGEFAGLRDYRPGDDSRDLHWPSTARRGALVTRVYETEGSDVSWIRFDIRRPPGDVAERALEDAASTAARLFRERRRFGFTTGAVRIEPATGRAHLERVLDAMARLDFDLSGPGPEDSGDLWGFVLDIGSPLTR
jgi:uncharacterized protein (DUF58 family)